MGDPLSPRMRFASLNEFRRYVFDDPSERNTGRPDDGRMTVAETVNLRNAWRLADVQLVPMTRAIANGRFDRSIVSFLDALRPGTLPTNGAHSVEDVHSLIIAFRAAIAGQVSRYNANVLTELLLKSVSYGVPSVEVLNAIRLFSAGGPIIELGAGRGYWAALLANGGSVVEAFDIDASGANPWLKHSSGDLLGSYGRFSERMWYPVANGTEGVLSSSDATTLLLVWPPKEAALASAALSRFRGHSVVYVGEPRGLGCAEDEFFEELWSNHWRLEEVVPVPHLPWERAAVFLYRRIVA